MSDAAVHFNPFADIGADVPADDVRNFAAGLARNGMPVADINGHLTARGVAPLVADSVEMAEQQRTDLLNDHNFVRRYQEGDPAAISKLTLLDLRISKGGARLTDRDPVAGDYRFQIAHRFDGAPDSKVEAYHGELATLSADLKLRPDLAKSFADLHLDAAARSARMLPEELGPYGEEQTEQLARVLGPDADQRMKVASELLSKTSGRPLDISRIAASNGAEAALVLIHQAEHLARARK